MDTVLYFYVKYLQTGYYFNLLTELHEICR